MQPNQEPLLGALRDDPALAAQLRKSVKLLADNAPDPAMGEMLKQVLDGKKSLRDVVMTTDFSEMFSPLAASAVAEAAHLTDEEREALAEQGRRQIDAEYEAASRSMSDHKESDQEDDDEYFRNQTSFMQSGW